jgi:hypothetical protein
MFYPGVFPVDNPALSAEEAMEAEFSTLCVAVQAGDRRYVRGQTPEMLPESMMHELHFLGVFPREREPEVLRLLEMNAGPIHRFICERLMEQPSQADWRWLEPDWNRLRERLGDAAVAEWKRRVAGQQSEPLVKVQEVAAS